MIKLISRARARETLAVLVAVSLSAVIITTIYSNIRSVEEALPRFGFLSFRELHAHIRDVDRLRDMVLLVRADPGSAEGRAFLSEAADLAYIRFAKVDRSRITAELEVYAGLRDRVLTIVRTIDDMLSGTNTPDQTVLRALTAELEEVEIELNRQYYSVGEESNEGLYAAQRALGTLNAQVLAILLILSTLLIGVALLLVQRQRAAKNLRRLAWHDSVTDLKNRAWLMEKSGKFILDAKAANKYLGMYLIDLDHFKQVNDTFGHHVGDRMLQVVSERLKAHNLHRSAAAVRLGGDEFAFVKAADSPEEFVELGETLCRELSGYLELDGHPVRLAASIGLSWYPDHGQDISLLLKRADLALYAAKADGRQRMVTYSSALKAHSDTRLEMEERIRKGLENDEFSLVWQPQLSVSTGRLTGAEALLRWNDRQSASTIQPPEFLPVARKSDLIVEIDRMVLRKACQQAAGWMPHFPDGFSISVNISDRQLEDQNLCAQLAGLLKETGLPAKALELDVTQHVFAQGTETVETTLAQIRRLGVSIALDDFGTGHTDLAGVAEMAIDRIKIDSTFLSKLRELPRGHRMVNSILSMCEALELKTLAKGVECADQLDFLAETNCISAQGFYISQPMSASVFSNYILRHGPGHEAASSDNRNVRLHSGSQ
ncbi:MAG: EAL domain-containing protein [Alphaproteobacteria bacterium]|nr:EAL domain-containing protein [Alphaproteobacteria bacterium]